MFQENSFQQKSLMHKLNPTLKFIAFVFIIVMIFLPLGFFAQTILVVILISLFFFSKLRKKVLWNIIKSVFFLFLILFIINWFLYKNPIAVYVSNWSIFSAPNGITIGKLSWINTSFLAANTSVPNNLLISQIWGGTIGINGSSYIGFNDQAIIDQIINSNKISTETIDNFWNKATPQIQNVFLKAFEGGLGDEYAKKYYWLINNNFNFNNLAYSPIAIHTHINLNQEFSVQAAQEFIKNSYYLVSTNWYTLSPQAIQLALYVSMKVFLMILAATLLTATTNSIELTNALENLLNPLKIFRLPVAEASMMIAIALRFIPSLLSESNRIMNAQASRGVDFKNGKFVDKMKSLVSLVVPLFSIAFKKAEELANAMDARAYNPRYARTKYRKYKVNWYDWLGFSALILLFGLFIAICKWQLFFTPFNLFELGLLISG